MDTMQIQARLNALGYKPVLNVDGWPGPKTDKAVEWFQKKAGLDVDGVVGPVTYAMLFPTPETLPLGPADPEGARVSSPQGLIFTANCERMVLTCYLDKIASPPIWTGGVGHTKYAGAPTPIPSLKLPAEEWWKVFVRDMERYADDVAKAIKVPLTQWQFDALVDWHYNTGAINKATLTKKINAGDFVGAAKEFYKWNKPAALVAKGGRREKELNLFVNADYGDTSTIPVQGVYPAGKIIKVSTKGLF